MNYITNPYHNTYHTIDHNNSSSVQKSDNIINGYSVEEYNLLNSMYLQLRDTSTESIADLELTRDELTGEFLGLHHKIAELESMVNKLNVEIIRLLDENNRLNQLIDNDDNNDDDDNDDNDNDNNNNNNNNNTANHNEGTQPIETDEHTEYGYFS